MKKQIVWIIILVMLLTACTANEPVPEPVAETEVTFPSESTEADSGKEMLVEEWKPFHTYQEVFETPNGYYAKYEGFVNTDENPIHSVDDALELAKKECTVWYNCITYWYYEEEDIWFVMFSEENTAGGNQDVYLGSDGITRLIIYGE